MTKQGHTESKGVALLSVEKGVDAVESTTVAGVDPGLVHTGVVRLGFWPNLKVVTVDHSVINGPDPRAVWLWLDGQQVDLTFIEGYRPRSAFSSDARMLLAVQNMSKMLPRSHVLNNTGVLKVVKKDLMELLGCWKFSTVTHHQDLRSAARIALLGMMKDPVMNRLLADVVLDHLAGRTWTVKS